MELVFGVEFGSTHICIYKKGDTIRREVAAIVKKYNEEKGEYEYGAFGNGIKETEGILDKDICYPVSGGVITDKQAFHELISRVFKYLFPKRKFLTSIVFYIVAECGLSVEQYNELREECYSIGVDKVFFVPSALCILRGLKLEKVRDGYYCIADMGAVASKLYIVKGNRVIDGVSIAFAGEQLNEYLKQYICSVMGYIVSDDQVEMIKKSCVSALDTDNAMVNVGCIDGDNQFVSKMFTSQDFLGVVNGFFSNICDAINTLLKKNPTYFAFVKNKELIICGGTSKFNGLKEYFLKELGMKSIVCQDNIVMTGLKYLIDGDLIGELEG